MKAGCLYLLRQYRAAVETADQALALNLTAAWYWRASALFMMGRHADGLRSLGFELGLATSRSAQAADKAQALVTRYNKGGLQGALGDLLEQTNSPKLAMQSHNRAMWFVLLGDDISALNELEVAVDSNPRPFNLIYIGVDPLFEPLRTHPRFQVLLRKLGLSL